MVKEVLANGRLAGSAAPAAVVALARQTGVTPDALSVAAALALECRPTVLLGAVSTSQLASNLVALDADGTAVSAHLPELAQPAESYWQQRSTLPWH
jgi:aryl-alcohol dehydrogenase-like predicted oxidoreductase